MREMLAVNVRLLALILGCACSVAHGADDDYAAVVVSATPGKCEMHPMLQEKKVQLLRKGFHLDATDSIRCRVGGEVSVTYTKTSGKFKLSSGSWKVVGNPGSELQEDMTQQRQGRSAKNVSVVQKLPS